MTVDQVGLSSVADPHAQVVARDDLESVLGRAMVDAMQLFLAELTADVTRRIRKNPGQPWEYVTVSLSAASSPLDPLSLGDLNRRWEWLVDTGIVETLRQQWAEANVPIGSAGWSSARATGHLLSYVRDRLVYGDHISPTVPEDAFDTIRTRLSEAQQQQWSADQTSQAIANDLGWVINRDRLTQQKEAAESAIAAILDPLGRPGDPVREHARRNDPEVRRLQSLRSDAVLGLDREQSRWKTRADRIARTEATVASGYATLQALHDEGWTHKQWISTLDDRTRDEHKIIDRDVQELDEPFQIESRGRIYSLQFPGDPAAPAELVVNCRCVLVGAEQGDSRLIYSPEYAPISDALAEQAKEYAADYAQWGPEFKKVKAEIGRIEDRIRVVFIDNPDPSDADMAEFEALDERRRELEGAVDWATDFITEAIDVWNAYQYVSDYRMINRVLRDALNPEREELANQWGWIVDHLGITTDREHVLYRGILSAGEDWVDKFPDGSIFADHGVISTTPRLNFARSWISTPAGDVGPVTPGSVLLEILVPAGKRIVGSNSNLEIMLPPGSQFRVLNTIRQKVAHYPGETTIVRMLLL